MKKSCRAFIILQTNAKLAKLVLIKSNNGNKTLPAFPSMPQNLNGGKTKSCWGTVHSNIIFHTFDAYRNFL